MNRENRNQDTEVRNEVEPGLRDDVPAGRIIKSSRLFGQSRTLIIEHAGERYRLQITKNERLILTK